MPRSVSLKPPTEAEVSTKTATLSLWDSLHYNVAHVLPAYMRGLFTLNRFWTTFWNELEADPAAVKFIDKMRSKYHSNYLYLYLLKTKSLLVLEQKGIKHVLDNSPDIYADAKLKRDGMSHFQPDALTISRGEEWRNRRAFNEAVLNTGQEVHQFADAFLEVISAETSTTLKQTKGKLTWDDFAHLFERITLQIIFGRGADDHILMQVLRKMMRESNRAFALQKSTYFDAFYASLSRRRREVEKPSLAMLCTHAPASEVTQVDNQIPHWIFAMGDTLVINTARAMALIVTHPLSEARVRDELKLANHHSSQGVNQLRYLEGCVQEAMRLWPTTPMLVRETTRDDVVDGVHVTAGTQVLILNGFNHRDRNNIEFADRFSPQVWLDKKSDYRFNHLSNGRQVCAGKDLALFIAKAVLANLLSERRYLVERPSLDPSKPLPYLYNHFRIKLTQRDM